jgi:very-long-chain enoyl-CoA reductase
MMIFPEWTTANQILYAALTLLALGVGFAEYFGQSMMFYSKFRSVKGIPSRVSMVILYASPIVAAVISARGYLATASPIQWLVLAAVWLHFAKRVLESLFLHKYSGVAGLLTTLLITSFYSTAAYLIGWLNQHPIPAVDLPFVLGLVLFLFGMAFNFYHHKLLADLRKNSLDYFIPKSGLFEYVVCPHYLFEIITWLGIALLSRHLAAWLILLFVISYLTARSLRTLQWYHQKFSDFPKDRKAILPAIL